MFSAGSIFKTLLLFALILQAGVFRSAAQQVSQLSGIVIDQNGALVPGVEITILNLGGTLERMVLTNDEGYFVFPFLPPDSYILKVSKEGFDPAEIPELLITEDKERLLKIELKINPVVEAVKVQNERADIEETKALGADFERRLIENLPLAGSRAQSLINLVPGIVLTPVDEKNLGQFSSNGQRTNSNYFTVDGVSANFGTTNYDFLGQTGGGSIPAMSVQGGLDNLVSAEALEEVKIRSLDFAPESGKTPGASVSLLSRSGTNAFSLSAFENYRSERFNAKDYFDLEKPPHDFSDYGFSAGGPLFLPKIVKNLNFQTYFFLAFERKRFTLPQPTVIAQVPSIEIRQDTQNAVAQAIYNAFPLPNEKKDGRDEKTSFQNFQNSIAAAAAADNSAVVLFPKTESFRATYADPNGAENYNLRIDHRLSPQNSLFVRFNQSPSFSENRNPSNLSAFTSSSQLTRTLTAGLNLGFFGNVVNEFRFNLSDQTSSTIHDFDGLFGGQLPDSSIFIPSVFETEKTHFRFSLNGFPDSLNFFYGNFAQNEMKQFFVADNFSFSTSNHQLKLGFDYRRLSPRLSIADYGIQYDFNSAESISLGMANRVSFDKNPIVTRKVLSISSFIQDNWQINSRINLLYGMRWEIRPAPRADKENALFTLENAPDLSERDQTKLLLADVGTPYYKTNYRNFAPRVGTAMRILDRHNWQLLLRGGVGTFYDLGQSQFNEIASPFQHSNSFAENLTLPLNNFLPDFLSGGTSANKRLSVVSAVSDYQLPRVYFWNFGAQIKTGTSHLLSVSYVGAVGRLLQRTLTVNLALPGAGDDVYFSDRFSKITYIDNSHTSDYHALQIQYSHRLKSGFESFFNYTWSHSIDSGSSDNKIASPFFNYPVINDRGNSDFDARHLFNARFIYDFPPLQLNGIAKKLLQNWTVSGIFFARSGLPFDVRVAEFNTFTNDFSIKRPNFQNDLPLYIRDENSPTGRRLNSEAFAVPEDFAKQGNFGRNRLFGPFVWQFDASVSRRIKLASKLNLQFKAEIYNVFNHPNFSNPRSTILLEKGERVVPQEFGVPDRTMARGYASNAPTGGVNPVFQTGGARSMQFSIRLNF